MNVVTGILLALTLAASMACLLYTSDAADDSLRVDLGGRRIIKKPTSPWPRRARDQRTTRREGRFFQAEDGIRDS
mgnify:CR=1 FL=1